MSPIQKNELRLVFWELTAGCNLKCLHCRAEATPERLAAELTTAECLSFIDQLAAFAKPILILTGGEPLYRPDIFELAAYATKKGLRTALATNGTLIDKTIAQKIAQSGIQRVSISIDGALPETHDRFRGIPGAYAKALAGLKLLQAAGVSTQLNTTIAKHNASEAEAIYQLALQEKVAALHFFMLVPVGCGVELNESELLTPQEYEEILVWFDQKAQDKSLELKATCAPHYHRIMRQRAKAEGREVTVETHGLAARTKGCLAGSGVCFISRIGAVQPCGYLPVVAGNIREQALSKIWQESPLFRDLRDSNLLTGKCGHCAYKNVCGGCRARAYSATGDYLAAEPYCIYG